MRFVSFTGAQGRPVAGVLCGDDVVDLSHRACKALLSGTPPSVQAFVEQGLDRWARHFAEARFDADAVRPLSQVQLLAPLPRPGKIIGAAYNFTDALAERGMAHPPEPVTFVRLGSTVIGPGAPILLPPDIGNVGYEAELAVVIGRRALRVERDQAMKYVAGYTAHNDISASDLIKGDGGNFVRGKNLPASAPLGPWLATPDEVPDPYDVGIRLDIDGRVLQDGSTSTMLFRIAELISFISYRMPLEPGDVIATGTPAGVAPMHQPPGWLTPGTTVAIELQGLGRLANPVHRGEPFLER
ncbi:fumarylacetoacetate hydrolase family protein [Caenimonas soli]|uniref:fumarylacetoacetate hydrolase family protein n=1 Tax=Caenimonas soli TaxID=2735555 RepID=UPI001552ACC8|nr:fumarylacetoacetate hydrolase family protein [Caenimonas soli]NPC58639.1 fumarylacetoacetate hydrolase family protein [Caenimonas soli]